MASEQQMARLAAAAPAAQAAQKKWGVPASITLAQWILESGWGASELATRANNFFGIKATHLDAPETYVEFPTHEFENGRRVIVHALFERYADAAESFDDHARLLARAARYRVAMAVNHDPALMAHYLQACGYSTSPEYARQLVELMADYGLNKYDTTPPTEPAERQGAAA